MADDEVIRLLRKAYVDELETVMNYMIATYRSLIRATREADDPVTEDLAIALLGDEESHRTEFRGFRKEYQRD